MSRYDPPFVYFARRADGDGPVKIGCSRWIEGRLLTLMTWSPYRLEIAARLPGDEVLERQFHAKFIEQHSHTEWFLPSPELTLVIAQIVSGAFDVRSLPAPRHLRSGKPKKPWTELQRLGASNSHRLSRLYTAKVVIPEEIKAIRYGPWGADELTRFRNARKVKLWLDEHYPRANGRRAAATRAGAAA